VGGPHRLYATVALADDGGAAAVEVRTGSGAATSLVLTKEHPRGRLVVDQVDRVDVTVRAADGNGTAEVDVVEAWLTSLPVCAVDLVAADPGLSWQPEPAGTAADAAVRKGMSLHDGSYYGPAVVALPMGGDGPRVWTAKQLLTVPGEAQVLRALFGFEGGPKPGTAARVSLTLMRAEGEWNLMRDLDIEVYPDAGDGEGGFRSNTLAVVEATLPREIVGREAIVQVEVRTESAAPFVFAIPCLRLCCG
jgi:hypothetical protein